ncbi:haloacid dehalogenase-like hydrolase [Conexibacter arvalis]|uniref:Phosphatidylglycerophosphatase C n=1 Tax=Conexibacter arvalis TaxID=912552 RepID=A0A840IIU2_9ACTN|nr:haloacid dehalogenase-like hydrolase [Conexibacter arvalis]MBB4664686.1 phosphatidylglycerophosphatase C [Conexibacter arvalis]
MELAGLPRLGPGETALFDLDGVLTRKDTFAGFVVGRLRRRPLRLALALPLVPFMLLPPTRRPAVTLAVKLALMRLTTEGYRAEAASYADALAATPRAIQHGCVEEARRHLDAGARVVFVTACEATVARELLDAVGLPEVELVASRLERRGRLWRVALHNLGEEKPRQLAAHGIVAPWAAAYSDHAVDLPLLGGARVAVLVNPSARLEETARRELAGRAPGGVRTARWPAG